MKNLSIIEAGKTAEDFTTIEVSDDLEVKIGDIVNGTAKDENGNTRQATGKVVEIA